MVVENGAKHIRLHVFFYTYVMNNDKFNMNTMLSLYYVSNDAEAAQ